MPAKVPKYISYTVNSFVGKSLAIMICNPLVIMKTRKELISNQSSNNNFFTGLNRIIREDGFSGLLKGVNTMISREVSFTICHYNLYQFLKEYMPENKFLPAFISSVGAMCISQPFEVVNNIIRVTVIFR